MLSATEVSDARSRARGTSIAIHLALRRRFTSSIKWHKPEQTVANAITVALGGGAITLFADAAVAAGRPPRTPSSTCRLRFSDAGCVSA